MLNRWLDLWRQKPICIATPLSPDAAGARVREALAELPTVMRTSGRYPLFRIHQRSRGADQLFRASSRRNNLAPLVRVRVVPVGTGCEVVGAYGWPLWIRLVTGAWAVGLLLMWGGMLEALATGGGEDGSVAVLVVVPPLMVVFHVVLVGTAGVRGRREAVLALEHIALRLGAVNVSSEEPR